MSYNSNLEGWDFPRIVRTPNIEEDIRVLLSEEIASAYNSNQNENSKKRIVRITEMLDFVRHIDAFTKILLENETTTVEEHEGKKWINSNILFHYHDYSGFQFDAEAFKYYTYLSIIDACSSQKNKYKKISEYIKESLDGKTKTDITIESIESVISEYEDTYGLSKNFRKVFWELISEETRESIANNLVVIKKRKEGYSKDELSKMISEWMSKKPYDRCKEIAKTLYDIRSSYTHNNIRNFLPQPTPEEYISEKIDPTLFDNNILICKKDNKLTDILMEIIKERALQILQQ